MVTKNRYDVVVGDEAYEVAGALSAHPELRTGPFTMIYDFVGLDSMTWRPSERLVVHAVNRRCGGHRGRRPGADLTLFIGEPEDVPDRRFGFLLPNRRDYARRYYEFVGYVFGFDPAAYADRASTRRLLGYDERPLVVCSIGGTSVGGDLLRLCAAAYPHVEARLPDVRTELTALRRPFVYFPLEGHFEQDRVVSERLARHRAGTRLEYSQTTPKMLAGSIVGLLGTEARWPPIATDGAPTGRSPDQQAHERPEGGLKAESGDHLAPDSLASGSHSQAVTAGFGTGLRGLSASFARTMSVSLRRLLATAPNRMQSPELRQTLAILLCRELAACVALVQDLARPAAVVRAERPGDEPDGSTDERDPGEHHESAPQPHPAAAPTGHVVAPPLVVGLGEDADQLDPHDGPPPRWTLDERWMS